MTSPHLDFELPLQLPAFLAPAADSIVGFIKSLLSPPQVASSSKAPGGVLAAALCAVCAGG